MPLGREMCLIFCMFWVNNLSSSLRDSMLFSCGSTVVVWDFHFVSSSVA